MISALISAILLTTSFPKFYFWPLAWIAFVPVFYGTRQQTSFKKSFLIFYLFGFFFFFASVEWLRHVSYFGWIFVATKYALYFGVFGLAVHWFWKRNQFFISLFALPSVWVVLEWIRTEVPVWGFGWNLLAYSQSFNLDVAGVASIIGAYGLSWLILFANVAIFFILDFEITRKKTEGIIAAVGILALAATFGVYFTCASEQNSQPAGQIRSVLVQGNIPQVKKWDARYRASILETHEQLSRLGMSKEEHPDLIVWPEAAYPGFYNIDPERERIRWLADELKTPVLFGGLYVDRSDPTRRRYFNSAYLVFPGSDVAERYDKVRLVSFGEYMPWRKFFGLIGLERLAYSLGVSDFEAGDQIKIFSLINGRFSVLICFENTFPFLSRKAVNQGAQFLVVVTNDAWFSKSAASYQHLQASVFRAIENGVPLIHVANTGVSAIIDANGKVVDRIKDQREHDTFIAGVLNRAVSFGAEKTFYRFRGFLFPYVCLIFIFVGFILTLTRKML